MDTTYLEYTAEDLIAHKLQRGGLLVAKPKFDRDGTDLIALMEVADGAKFCRIQCKGRSLISSVNSNVEIPKEYIQGAFLVFLYIDVGDNDPHIFCFAKEEIEVNWNLKTNKRHKENYHLNFSKTTFREKLSAYRFTTDRIDQIKEIIGKSVSKKEIELLKILKKQKDLIKKKDECNSLEKHIMRIEYLEESIKSKTEYLEIIEEQYLSGLAELSEDLPEKLNLKITTLLSEAVSVSEIVSQVEKDFPNVISPDLLQYYINKVLLNNQSIERDG